MGIVRRRVPLLSVSCVPGGVWVVSGLALGCAWIMHCLSSQNWLGYGWPQPPRPQVLAGGANKIQQTTPTTLLAGVQCTSESRPLAVCCTRANITAIGSIRPCLALSRFACGRACAQQRPTRVVLQERQRHTSRALGAACMGCVLGPKEQSPDTQSPLHSRSACRPCMTTG